MTSRPNPSAPAHIHTHCGQALELVSIESDSAIEFHLTVRPCDGESVADVARRAAAEINARQATVVRLLAFGLCEASEKTLAALRSKLKDDRLPVTWVEGRSCDGHPLAGLQIHAVAENPAHPGRDKRATRLAPSPPKTRITGPATSVRTWQDTLASHCVLTGLTPNLTTATPAEQATELFRSLQERLAEAGLTMKQVARTWFFLDDVLSWYGDFNRVRSDFFTRHGIRVGDMPASTGVQGRNPAGAALTAAVWAIQAHDPSVSLVRALASPGQCPAPAYGSAFNRAVEIASDGFRQVLVSGTASIAADGQTCHAGDVLGQIDRTMEVVEGILTSRGMTLANASRAIAYFKRAPDAPIFADWLARRGLKNLPLLNVECDICRPDLLFELELDAVQAGDP